MTQTGGGQTEAIVDLPALLVDDVHPVRGELLPAHRRGQRRVGVVLTGISLADTLLYLNTLPVLLVIHDKHKLSFNVFGFLGVNCALPVVTRPRFLQKIASQQRRFRCKVWFCVKNCISDEPRGHNAVSDVYVGWIISDAVTEKLSVRAGQYQGRLLRSILLLSLVSLDLQVGEDHGGEADGDEEGEDQDCDQLHDAVWTGLASQ